MLSITGLTSLVILLAAVGAHLDRVSRKARLRALLAVPVARIALLLAAIVVISGCGGSSTAPSTTVTPPSAPFSATDLTIGTGATASPGRTLTVAYTGWLYDPTKPESKGAQFDSQPTFSFQLSVGGVIAGWDQGLLGMRVGGQRRLVIPPSLGYGAQMVGSIPANSTLVFDVMLLNVT